MSKNSNSNLSTRKLKKMRPLFGKPPVLSTERHVHYQKLFNHYVEYVQPRNILELTLLTHLVDAMWVIKRYNRHHTLGIERSYQQSLAYQAKRAKSQEDQKQSNANYRAEMAGFRPRDIAELVELEDADEEVFADTHEVDRRVAEIDHNRALEQGLAFQEGLDSLLNSATARFNKALQLLEQCRAGLGQLLGQVTDQVVDAEYNEVAGDQQQIESPSLASDHAAQSAVSDEHAAPPPVGG